YPEGSPGRIDQFKTLSAVYSQLGQLPLVTKNQAGQIIDHTGIKERYYNEAFRLMDMTKTELDRAKRIADVQLPSVKTAMNQSIDKQQEALRKDAMQSRLEVFGMLSRRPDAKTSEYMQGRLREMSAKMEQDLAAMSDKTAPVYKAQRFVKDWLDVSIAPDDKKAAAIAKAEASLEDAMKTFAEKVGPAHPQYEMMMKKLWSFHAQYGQAEKAEAFFKKGLDATQGDGQVPARLVLLRQYHTFLKNQKRDAEAAEIATQFSRLNGR
ncbi:MAG: hypothetical protein K2X27_18525, partial [Candidatus Obscuribacterales bacterium]|nr:hypothetical protein [Candidatus Obscuribacterales bacterium]